MPVVKDLQVYGRHELCVEFLLPSRSKYRVWDWLMAKRPRSHVQNKMLTKSVWGWTATHTLPIPSVLGSGMNITGAYEAVL